MWYSVSLQEYPRVRQREREREVSRLNIDRYTRYISVPEIPQYYTGSNGKRICISVLCRTPVLVYLYKTGYTVLTAYR